MPLPWIIGGLLAYGAYKILTSDDDHHHHHSSSSSGSYETHESSSQRIENECKERYEEAQQVNDLVYKSLSALEQVTGKNFESRRVTTSYFDLSSHSSSSIESFNDYLGNHLGELKSLGAKVTENMNRFVEGKKCGFQSGSRKSEILSDLHSARDIYLNCAKGIFGYFDS